MQNVVVTCAKVTFVNLVGLQSKYNTNVIIYWNEIMAYSRVSLILAVNAYLIFNTKTIQLGFFFRYDFFPFWEGCGRSAWCKNSRDDTDNFDELWTLI